MKAPEKVYFSLNENGTHYYTEGIPSEREYVEYVRKDAFIENPDERMIAKYLYEKKGYPIDLNGNLPSWDETMKDVENYLKYKQDKFIEKACGWIGNNVHKYAKNTLGKEYLVNDFKEYIKGE